MLDILENLNHGYQFRSGVEMTGMVKILRYLSVLKMKKKEINVVVSFLKLIIVSIQNLNLKSFLGIL